MISRASPPPEIGSHWALATVLSVSIHAGIFAWAFDLIPDFTPSAPRQIPETIITVSTTLAEPPDDQSGDPLGTDTVLPSDDVETLEPTVEPPPAAETGEADELAPVDAPNQAQDAPDPDTADTVPPDTLTALETPSVAQAAPPATLAPVMPDAMGQAAPVATLGGVAPTATLGAVAPQMLPTTPLSALPAQPGPGTTTTALSSVLPASPPPPTTPAAPPQAADPALALLVERIRGRLDDPCLVALPRPQVAPLGPLVLMLSDQDVTAQRFADSILTDPDLPTDAQTILIDARQCPALTFLRAQPRYPAFRLNLGLAQADIASGGTLVGRVEGGGAGYTSLLLVDDNGVVQDLRRFLRFTGGRAEFAIPMTRDGAARETSQLLIAIATPTRPATIADLAGRLATDVFPALAEEIGPRAAFAVQPIIIR